MLLAREGAVLPRHLSVVVALAADVGGLVDVANRIVSHRRDRPG